MAKNDKSEGITVSCVEPRKFYLAMKLEAGMVELQCSDGHKEKLQITLPDGCAGMVFAFESPEAAQKWYDKDVPLISIVEDGSLNNR